MATKYKTVTYAFDARTTNLATATAIASSTTHTFPAITADIAETSSRTPLSVTLELLFRENTTTQNGPTKVRGGLKIGAVAISTQDKMNGNSGFPGQTGERFLFDFTTYWNTNYTGSTQSIQASIAVEEVTAGNVIQCCAYVHVTYSYDDSVVNNPTRTKTVRYVLGSHHTTLTNVQQEIGVAGTTPPSANQIPILTGASGVLKEASITIKQAFVRLEANDANNGTTAFNFEYQIDAAAVAARGTLNCGQGLATTYVDCFIYDTATFSTTSAHAFKGRGSITGMFANLGAILYVTYTYDEATTTEVTNQGDYGTSLTEDRYINSATDGGDIISVDVYVEEPTTIAIQQCGIEFTHYNDEGAGSETLLVSAGSQVARTYTIPSINNSGAYKFYHRVDHSSGWTLSRGKNTLTFTVSQSTGFRNPRGYSARLIISYSSGKSTQGTGAHKQITHWYLAGLGNINGDGINNAWLWFLNADAPKTPTMPTAYMLESAMLMVNHRMGNTANASHAVAAKRLSGEGNDLGWATVCAHIGGGGNGQGGNKWSPYDITSFFNRYSTVTGKMAIDGARKWMASGNQSGCYIGAELILTFSAITFTVAGTTSFSGSGTETINVYRVDTYERIGTTTITGDGAYSVTAFDDTINVFVEAIDGTTNRGRSRNGTAT